MDHDRESGDSQVWSSLQYGPKNSEKFSLCGVTVAVT